MDQLFKQPYRHKAAHALCLERHLISGPASRVANIVTEGGHRTTTRL